jgi:hypothetical protein
VGHTLRRIHPWEKEEKGRKPKLGWCTPCWGVNKALLNLQSPLWEGDQEAANMCDRDKPMCTEAMLGNCYLYPELAKIMSFLTVSDVFSSTYSEKRAEQVLLWNGEEAHIK